MKKKILLLAIMVAVLACLFALSVGAKTMTYEGQEVEIIDNLGDPSWYTGDTALAIQDKESVVILKDANGNMTAYPSYYIFRFYTEKKDGEFTVVRVTWADQKAVDYSFINEKTGKNYESGSIYYMELPYGITTCFGNTAVWGKDAESKPEPNVVEIVIPDSVTKIESQSFRRMNNCKKVTISKNVKTIESWAFCGSPKLETIVFPEGCVVETINNAFSSCTALNSINLENCTSLKTLGAGVFNGCKALRKLALPDSLETIGDKAFYQIGEFELASDYLPKNLTTIGTHFLSGNILKNETLYFPEGFTNLSASYHFNDGFKPNTSLTLVFLGKMTNVNISNVALTYFTSYGTKQPLNLIFAKNTYNELGGTFLTATVLNEAEGYIYKYSDGRTPYFEKQGTLTVSLCNNDPNSGTSLGTDADGNSLYKLAGAPAKLTFCGGDKIEYSYSVRNASTDKSWFRFHTTSFEYDMTTHTTHYNSVVKQEGNCGYDEMLTKTCVLCKLQTIERGVLATGKHSYEDDLNCETALNCDVCKKELSAALTHKITVTVVYENGYMKDGLKTQVCTNDTCSHTVSDTLLPIFAFNGYSTNDEQNAICVGYSVNQISLKEYNAVNEALRFGAVASAKTENILSVNNGIVVGASNTVVAEIGSDYSSFDFILSGFGEAQNELVLVVCAYVYDGKSVSYLQDDMISAPATITLQAVIDGKKNEEIA